MTKREHDDEDHDFMTSMSIIECYDCGWRGKDIELWEKDHGQFACPGCGSLDIHEDHLAQEDEDD